jgi:hypothetical protein
MKAERIYYMFAPKAMSTAYEQNDKRGDQEDGDKAVC